MTDWYQTNLVDTGRSAALWLLVGFLVTFTITRRITLRIRTRILTSPPGDREEEVESDGLIKNIHIGGVHVHHQVWGILLVMTTGLLEFRYAPGSPWQEILATIFGAGAALALDEFALWLHLEDVYWTEEGRKSIDAVMIAGVVGLGLLVGTAPLGLAAGANRTGLWIASLTVLIHIGYTVVCLLKGKVPAGLIGLIVPIVSIVGSIRLAKPGSFWARRFYGHGKMHRAERRGTRDNLRRESLRSRSAAHRYDAPTQAASLLLVSTVGRAGVGGPRQRRPGCDTLFVAARVSVWHSCWGARRCPAHACAGWSLHHEGPRYAFVSRAVSCSMTQRVGRAFPLFKMVDLTQQHKNRAEVLVHGAEIVVRPVGTRHP